MKTLFIGQKIIRLEQTDSSNSHLMRLLEKEKLPEGTVVLAERQEQGRGQRGTHWESEPGQNITLSLLLRPVFLKADEQFLLSKAVAVSVADLISSLLPSLPPAQVKWPNDIYLVDKKVAGILIENSVSGNNLSHSVIGIGINVNQEKFSDELLNPISLKLISKKEFDLKECIEQLCFFLERRYLQLRTHPNIIDADYIEHLFRMEEWSAYRHKGQRVNAKIIGVKRTGKLNLLLDSGLEIACDLKEIEYVL